VWLDIELLDHEVWQADAGPPIGRVSQDSFWEPRPHRLPDREHMTARMRLPAGVGG